jgi:hypothetical protein
MTLNEMSIMMVFLVISSLSLSFSQLSILQIISFSFLTNYKPVVHFKIAVN